MENFSTGFPQARISAPWGSVTSIPTGATPNRHKIFFPFDIGTYIAPKLAFSDQVM
jgi:hypothetical protein